MTLHYRMLTENDRPALQELWMEETNWGPITEQMWQRYVGEGPLGGVTGAVAVEDGRIVGQFAFSPWRVTVNGREYRAFRMSAAIVAKKLRFASSDPLAHPAMGMYLHAAKELGARGDGLIYALPDPYWMRFARTFPRFQEGKFPLLSLDLPLAAEWAMPEGFTAAPFAALDDERVDRLWQTWSGFHPCSVVRDSRSLPWKIGTGEYEVLGIERGGGLAGLVASRRQGSHQWLICDVMAADCEESLRATIIAVVNLANRRALQAEPSKPIRKAAVLATATLEPVLRSLGFVRDDYDFPMIVHILDDGISQNDVAPERWYVSAND
jgi:hypothetical protein